MEEIDLSNTTDEEYWHVDAVCSNSDKDLRAITTLTCSKSFNYVIFYAKVGNVTSHKELPLKDNQSYTEIVSNVILKDKLDLSSIVNTCSLCMKSVEIIQIALA